MKTVGGLRAVCNVFMLSELRSYGSSEQLQLQLQQWLQLELFVVVLLNGFIFMQSYAA